MAIPMLKKEHLIQFGGAERSKVSLLRFTVPERGLGLRIGPCR